MPRFREHHLVLCLLVGATLLRLAPHPDNIAPLGAMALFTGAYLQRLGLWLVPLAGLAIGDLLNGQQSPVVLSTACGGFLVTAALGRTWLLQRDAPRRIATALPLAALICWLTTSLAVSMANQSLPVEGLVATLRQASPQLLWHLLGDGCYAALLFGIYRLTREASFVYYTPQH